MRWTLCLMLFVAAIVVVATACVTSGAGAVPPGAVPPDPSSGQAAMPPDMGQQCTRASDCGGGACVKSQKFTMYGYCSKPCTDWPECPTYWSCEKNPVNQALACTQPSS